MAPAKRARKAPRKPKRAAGAPSRKKIEKFRKTQGKLLEQPYVSTGGGMDFPVIPYPKSTGRDSFMAAKAAFLQL